MTEKESRMKMMDQIITAACGPAKSDHATHRHLIRSCIFNRTVCRVRLWKSSFRWRFRSDNV